MILARGNRICEISSTVGDGAYTLDGAIVGYFPFSSACLEGSVCEYSAEAIDTHGALTGPCEVGLGQFGPGNILSRTQVYSGSNGNQPVVWKAGSKRIALTLTAESLNSLSQSNNISTASFQYIASQLNGVVQAVTTIANTPVFFTQSSNTSAASFQDMTAQLIGAVQAVTTIANTPSYFSQSNNISVASVQSVIAQLNGVVQPVTTIANAPDYFDFSTIYQLST